MHIHLFNTYLNIYFLMDLVWLAYIMYKFIYFPIHDFIN